MAKIVKLFSAECLLPMIFDNSVFFGTGVHGLLFLRCTKSFGYIKAFNLSELIIY